MSVRVTFHPSAEGELDEAAQFYGRIHVGLAHAFLLEMERSIQSVCDHPKSAPLIAGSLRRRLAHRFPYSIIYREISDGIRVLAIAHLKRRPMYWASRT